MKLLQIKASHTNFLTPSAENARQTVMRGNKGEDLDVVITDLKIRVPIDSSLFDIITANKLVDQHGK